MIAAIVPMKPLAQAKQRLSPVLSDAARRDLVALMLAEVLEHLRGCPAVSARYVVTADADIAALAARHGAGHLPEPRAAGLNEAVRAAAQQLQGQGVDAILYLPGDVPLTTPEEIARMIEAAAGRGMAAAPAHDGDGTNALLLSPPQGLSPAFGPGSFRLHMQAAREAGLDPMPLRLDGVARDIDRPEDVAFLAARRQGDARYAFLSDALAQSPMQTV